MGKNKNKHVLKAPKIKNKTYFQPSKDETFVVVINPPRKPENGQEVPHGLHLQTWISAIAGVPHGVVEEIYTITTVCRYLDAGVLLQRACSDALINTQHSEPILKLSNVDLATTPILGLHHWREFIRDMPPGHKLWDKQTVIAEYDVKRCNHPKNISNAPYPLIFLGLCLISLSRLPCQRSRGT